MVVYYERCIIIETLKSVHICIYITMIKQLEYIQFEYIQLNSEVTELVYEYNSM